MQILRGLININTAGYMILTVFETHFTEMLSLGFNEFSSCSLTSQSLARESNPTAHRLRNQQYHHNHSVLLFQ